ncbi:hypothetical protein [Tepidibacter hydrothermalis]|uniref:Uncharacterized protein n=1 Tax=Tepidibacter hydrothermalis TaxID=3036126 RepID=A0ABY8ECY3_9FIRM|nr:hypothetical protein [Tepidibacter hydrothermalis]WFD09644.1 hypothetical protein P4S50_14800 [Tepidibacter hydrothermalis]
MWYILGILTVSIGITLYEVPYLLKKNLKRESWAFFILLIFGIILSIVESLNISISNPLDWLTFIYKPFTDFILGLLK